MAAQQYFHKRRGLAVAVTTAGISIGSFMWPPLAAFLLQRFAWRGTVLILSAVQFNGLVLGALMRPPPPVLINVVSTTNTETHPERKRKSADGSVSEAISMNGSVDVVTEEKKTESHSMNNYLCESEELLDSENQQIQKEKSDDDDTKTKVDDGLESLPENVHSKNPAKDKEITHIQKASGTDTSCLGFCRSLLDFSICRNPTFVLYGLGIYLQKIGHFLPFTFLPYRALVLGVPRTRAAALVSIVGILSGVGRLVFGFLVDRVGPRRVYLNGISATLAGISTALSVFCTTFVPLAVYAGIFGALSGKQLFALHAVGLLLAMSCCNRLFCETLMLH